LRSCFPWLVCVLLACGLASAQGPAKFPKKNVDTPPVGVVVTRDVEYARRGDRALKLDLYLPEKRNVEKLPVVAWIHGGGWSKGSKDRTPAAYLAAEGFAVASVEYRLTGEAIWPAQIDDCRDAIRFLRSHAGDYGLDADKFGVWGGSAGGHLVALLGTLDVPTDEAVSSRVQAVCDWYGPSDLLTTPSNTPGPGKTDADLAKSNGALLLGGIVRDRPKLAMQASAFHQVSKGDAPFLIMHGDADPQVPLEQSTKLYEKLKATGVPVTYEVLKGAGHGGPAFQTDEVKQAVRDFFAMHLK